MMEHAVFDTQSGARIGAVVRQVEGSPKNRPQKRGRYPIISSDGGGKHVKFTIDSFDDVTGIATCTVRYQDFDGAVPGEDADEKIEVTDVDGCFFNEAGAALSGRKGDARWMRDSSDPTADFKWVCCGLCCGGAGT